MAAKTNAARFLDNLGLSYQLVPYPASAEHLPAAEVARLIGMPPEQVFKTLLGLGDRTGHLLAVIPGSADLDLKKLARASGNRKASLVPLKQVQPLTGYVRGAVTALAAKKTFPVYLDESAFEHHQIAVSSGVKGLQIRIAPDDYARAVQATRAALRAEGDR